MRAYQHGNVVIFILLAVGLFGALAYSFTRGSQQSQGNMNEQQAKIAAQEIANFLGQVDKGVQKLRSRGCSESDISFSSPNDTSNYVTFNDSPTAPPDKTCHVFDSAGGGVTFSLSPFQYQISLAQITALSPGSESNYSNIGFLSTGASTVGVGTAANDIMAHFNFIQPLICETYNNILGYNIDKSVTDSGPILGDENTDYVGKETVCRYIHSAGNVVYGQIRYVWVAK